MQDAARAEGGAGVWLVRPVRFDTPGLAGLGRQHGRQWCSGLPTICRTQLTTSGTMGPWLGTSTHVPLGEHPYVSHLWMMPIMHITDPARPPEGMLASAGPHKNPLLHKSLAHHLVWYVWLGSKAALPIRRQKASMTDVNNKKIMNVPW